VARPVEEGAMVRFLINKKGVYYLTTGRLLKYDAADAKNPEQKRGVEEVRCKFEEIKNQPHTWYESVELTDSSFSPMNTGQEE
jgi:hypothetical protein